MPLSKIPAVGVDATGTPSSTTFLRGDNTWSAAGGITSGTTVTLTTKTFEDFTGIPSTAKRITVMFSNVSTSGTTDWGIRLGTSSGIESTGYLGSTSNSSPSGVNETTLARVIYSLSAATISQGFVTITYMGSNLWVISGSNGRSSVFYTDTCGYAKTTASTLDRVRITTGNGTDTFDSGSVNIMWE
jgi:hypothetical protein